jgi:hypothetical protein
MKPHRGPVILVFGILGFVVCPIFGVAAWSMGTADLQEMARGRMDSAGRDLTKAGRLCGMISTALMSIWVLLIVLFFVGALVAHR